ncbi:hypothetical protein C0991_002855, partial [Blastosporella zonata]
MTGTAATIVSASAATDKLLNAAALASPPPAPVQIAADIKNTADELPDSRVVPASELPVLSTPTDADLAPDVESTVQAETANAVQNADADAHANDAPTPLQPTPLQPTPPHAL